LGLDAAGGQPAGGDSQAFIRFDTNRYSVPNDHPARALALVGGRADLRVPDRATCIAHRKRDYGQHQVIERTDHRAAFVAERRAVRHLKGRDRLRAAAPDIGALVERWALATSTQDRNCCIQIVLGQLVSPVW
jgi:hypothetical protein